MKTIKSLMLAFLGGMLVTSMAFAQNYKAHNIDASGNFTNSNGENIGMVTSEGVIDESGVKVAHLDSDGSIIDTKTGKKLGKAEKNGDFVYNFSDSGNGKKFTISPVSKGTCEVKDSNGNVVMIVHENYKAQAACAYHCTKMKKNKK